MMVQGQVTDVPLKGPECSQLLHPANWISAVGVPWGSPSSGIWHLAMGAVPQRDRGVVQPVCSRTRLVAGIRVAGQKVALPILRWRGPIGSGRSREFGGNAAEKRHRQTGYVEGWQGLREPKAMRSLDASAVRLREHPGASSSTGELVILLITASDCAKLWKLADYCKLPKRMSLAGGLKVSIAEECLALAGQYGKLGCFLLKMGKTLISQSFSVCLGNAGWRELLVFLAFGISCISL